MILKCCDLWRASRIISYSPITSNKNKLGTLGAYYQIFAVSCSSSLKSTISKFNFRCIHQLKRWEWSRQVWAKSRVRPKDPSLASHTSASKEFLTPNHPWETYALPNRYQSLPGPTSLTCPETRNLQHVGKSTRSFPRATPDS